MTDVARQDFTVKKGDSWVRRITFKDADGVAIDISGWAFQLHIREDYEASEAEFELELDAGIEIIGEETDGTIEITLTEEDTDAVEIDLTVTTPGRRIPKVEYVYDFVATDDGGVVNTEMEGLFTFEARVTR